MPTRQDFDAARDYLVAQILDDGPGETEAVENGINAILALHELCMEPAKQHMATLLASLRSTGRPDEIPAYRAQARAAAADWAYLMKRMATE